MKKRFVWIIFSLLILLSVFLPPCILLINHTSGANPYLVENATLNLNQIDLRKEKNGIYFSGEMEFYYNSWICTDEEEKEKDAMITLPGRFNELTVDGEKLTNDGYASYRFYLENYRPGSSFAITTDHYYSSFRVFFNRTLVAQSGTLGKTRNLDKPSMRVVNNNSYIPHEKRIEVIIEVGNSGQGGLVKGPKLISGQIDTNETRGGQLILFSLMGLFLACIILQCITTSISYGAKTSALITFTSLSLFFNWLFSGEGLKIMLLINPSFLTFPLNKTLSLLFAQLFILFAFLFAWSQRSHNKQLIPYSIMLGISSIFSILAILFMPMKWGVVFPLLSVYVALGMIIMYIRATNKFTMINITFMLFFLLVFSVFQIFYFNEWNFFTTNVSYSFSILLLIAYLFIYFTIFFSIFRLRKEEERKDKLLKEQSNLKNLALKEQYNPNTIFNTLAILENFYRKNIQLGDKGLDLLAKDLRYSINSMEKSLVPFSSESEDALLYSDFENLREGKELPVLFNIEEEDFLIPPLVLKPILQCAYQQKDYKGEEENNYLEISTYHGRRHLYLSVIDHRFGYDCMSLNKELSNVKERLYLTLKGNITFYYDKNQTVTTISIPLTRKIKGGFIQ